MLTKHKETRHIFSFPLEFFLTSLFGTITPRLNDFWIGVLFPSSCRLNFT